jgi:hypothetical protein
MMDIKDIDPEIKDKIIEEHYENLEQERKEKAQKRILEEALVAAVGFAYQQASKDAWFGDVHPDEEMDPRDRNNWS